MAGTMQAYERLAGLAQVSLRIASASVSRACLLTSPSLAGCAKVWVSDTLCRRPCRGYSQRVVDLAEICAANWE